jgi:hypothetical protein
MSSTSNPFRVLLALSLIVTLGVVTFADTLRLKDGSIIKGKIVGFAGGTFTVTIGEGSRKRQMTFAADEIESIAFDAPIQNSMVPAANRTASIERPVDKPAPAEEYTSETVETKEPERTAPPVSAPVKKVSFGKPVELAVKVRADNTANGWTNSGWVVKKGQRIRISGSGEVSIGGGKTTSPSGLYDLEDGGKLLKSVPTGALIAVIGDDNNDFIYIGSQREFTATRDGALFLGLNEGNLNDNAGTFDVKVEISPEGGGE